MTPYDESEGSPEKFPLRTFSVTPISKEIVTRATNSASFDILIAAIGYEARAVFITEQLSGATRRIVAAPFPDNRLLHYERNNARFHRLHAKIISGDSEYRLQLVAELNREMANRTPDESPLRVAVDISSMSRQRLAETMRALYNDLRCPIDVSWLYAPAKYSSKLGKGGPVAVNDAIPGFEGWGDPMRPLSAIVGLGFEGELALGVLDDLEPADTWIFEPHGFAVSYDRRVRTFNQAVFGAIPEARRLSYSIVDPYTSFLRLSSLVSDLTNDGRVVLLPLGPKIFALMSLLIAIGDQHNVTVWRLSTGYGRPPVDRIAAGVVVGLRGVLSQ